MTATKFYTPIEMSPAEFAPVKTELEQLEAACSALGRDLDEIKVHDDWTQGFCLAPAGERYIATWGDFDLDCQTGTGPTPQAAMWELVDFTDRSEPDPDEAYGARVDYEMDRDR